MARYGMVIDLDRCSGCQACVVACCVENNLPLGNPEEGDPGRLIRWIQLLPQVEGEYPHLKADLLPVMCQHCDRPPCTFVCPVSATYRNPEGLVAQVYWRCIGCRYCLNACPYTVKFFNWRTPEFPEPLPAATNPDVAVRERGVAEKCTFCHHRLQSAKEEVRAEGRQLRPEDYQPACAEACPSRAITFGDLDDPDSEVSTLARDPRADHLLEELGTKPKVVYLKRR